MVLADWLMLPTISFLPHVSWKQFWKHEEVPGESLWQEYLTGGSVDFLLCLETSHVRVAPLRWQSIVHWVNVLSASSQHLVEVSASVCPLRVFADVNHSCQDGVLYLHKVHFPTLSFLLPFLVLILLERTCLHQPFAHRGIPSVEERQDDVLFFPFIYQVSE